VLLAVGLYFIFMQGRGYNTFVHNGGIRWALATLVWLGSGLALASLVPLISKRTRADYLEKIKYWLPELLLSSGLAALAFSNPFNSDQKVYSYFVAIVAAWGFANSALTAFQAASAAKGSQDRKDAVTSTALNVVLGLLFLIAPLGALPATGFFAAYLAIMGIHLGISAATPHKG